MAFEEDDAVVYHDKHSEYDGQVGTVTQVMETMFGDANYTVSFEDGQEQGVPEDNLDAADESDLEDADESNVTEDAEADSLGAEDAEAAGAEDA